MDLQKGGDRAEPRLETRLSVAIPYAKRGDFGSDSSQIVNARIGRVSLRIPNSCSVVPLRRRADHARSVPHLRRPRGACGTQQRPETLSFRPSSTCLPDWFCQSLHQFGIPTREVGACSTCPSLDAGSAGITNLSRRPRITRHAREGGSIPRLARSLAAPNYWPPRPRPPCPCPGAGSGLRGSLSSRLAARYAKPAAIVAIRVTSLGCSRSYESRFV